MNLVRALLLDVVTIEGFEIIFIPAAAAHESDLLSAMALSPKTWYGMPAYAKDGKVVCFFQSAQKFNAR